MLTHGYKWEQGIERVGQIFCTIMSCVNSISFENAPDKAWRINIRRAGIFFNKMASVLLNFSNSARNLHARCANAGDIPVLAELDLSSDRATKTSEVHPASSKRPDTPPQGKNAARLSWQHPRAPHEMYSYHRAFWPDFLHTALAFMFKISFFNLHIRSDILSLTIAFSL